MVKYVYDFVEGDKDLTHLLGVKGAGLAEMTRLGLPVPPGFTITTEACRVFLGTGDLPDGFLAQVAEHLRWLEMRMERDVGDRDDPLLVSIRTSSASDVRRLMETVLNIGLNDTTVAGLAARTGNPRFAWDSYRRLIQMFGTMVFGVPASAFDEALAEATWSRTIASELDLNAAALRGLAQEYKRIFRTYVGRDFPQAPHEQLFLAIRAAQESWTAEPAKAYRRAMGVADDGGAAITVAAMVFGNLGAGSGTGIAFTRDPVTGARGVYGEYLQNAQGEDVVAGIRATVPLQRLAELDPHSFAELSRVVRRLEAHYRGVCAVEFTIECGRVWMLEARAGVSKFPTEPALAISATRR